MSRSVARADSRTRVVLAVCAAASAFALAGCGAGQITQTATQASGVEGASANIGQIAVRGAEFPFAGDGKSAVTYQSGGSAPLAMTVANFGAQPDKLTAVSSPVADSVKITGDGTVSAGKLLVVEGGSTSSTTAQAAPTSAPPSSAVAPSSGTPTTAGAAATPTTPPAIVTPTVESGATGSAPNASVTATPNPSEGAVASPSAEAVTPTPSPEGTTSAQVVLTGLKQDIKAGLTYPVVLTFQQAGDVTVQVPVGNPKDSAVE